GDLDHVFFANSGSEAVDSALKIALAYHQSRGEPARVRFIGRSRGYHGVGFCGISVGGIESNRKAFAAQLLPQVDLLPNTHDLAHNAFSRGQPAWGAHLADALEEIVARRGAETIAAVIVEPVAGSTGVLVPPRGYLERLRALCTQHGILLIFDEVITGFGRLGAAFGAGYFGVLPDMMTVAKGITNGAVPMGAVVVRRGIYAPGSTAPPSQASNSSTATPTPGTRSRQRRAWRRWSSTVPRDFSSGRPGWPPSGRSRSIHSGMSRRCWTFATWGWWPASSWHLA